MPFTVIVLKKVPASLKGDLTRWMQEIGTGTYVGNYNSRVREYLWKRVIDAVGDGEATICYACRNEIGYSFCTYNTDSQVVDYDGIPLILIPSKNTLEENQKEPRGFSNARAFHRASRKVRAKITNAQQITGNKGVDASFADPDKQMKPDLVFLDLETTGLDADTDQIIEIGAIKVSGSKQVEFHRLIRTEKHIPDAVRVLTGITDNMLENGTDLKASIIELNDFIRDAVLVGFNISFDIRFINNVLDRLSLEPIHNKTLELMHEAKKRNSFQANYKFETTLKEYGITQTVHHRALDDASLMIQLYNKMEL